MKKTIAVLGLLVLITACAPEPGSMHWCDAMDDKPKSGWSLDDGMTYTKHCLIDDLAIGSDKWCEKLDKKPKGEWEVDEAASYARYCVVTVPKNEAK